MHRATLIAALGGALLLGGCANPTRSRDLANPNVSALTLAQQVCSNCHGLSGNSVSPNFPKLAAQTPEYLVAQLEGFRSHDRQDPAGFEYMWGLSRSLSDAQINGLARYYAAQKPQPAAESAEPTQVAAGRTIFETGIGAKSVPACASCHGAQGQGNGQFPRIGGQHADYVVKQLTVFQRTDERPEGAIMKTVAHELSRADMQQVAAFVQTLGAQ